MPYLPSFLSSFVDQLLFFPNPGIIRVFKGSLFFILFYNTKVFFPLKEKMKEELISHDSEKCQKNQQVNVKGAIDSRDRGHDK